VHLVLVDLTASDLDGRQAEDRLHEIGVTVNRNAVPDDPRPPVITSGLRIGTPALATRGFDAGDFGEVAEVVAAALQPELPRPVRDDLRSRVAALAARRPLYPADLMGEMFADGGA
jgi:glycine hydroxymethyltransferase